MFHRIPPFKSIKAFESVARLGSFSKAADELYVSPAAISQHVKLLEEVLDVSLFDRNQRSVRLTAAGKVYFPLINEGFNNFHKAGQQLAAFNSKIQIIVSALPSLASNWLSPNLFQWTEKYPDVDIKIVAQHKEVDFNVSEVDFRISYGPVNAENLQVEKLFLDEVFPVCSPALMKSPNQLKSVDKLKDETLIHVEWGDQFSPPPSWEDWAVAAGIEDLDTKKGPQYNLTNMAIQAAVEGRGVLLGQKMLIKKDFEAGRLLKPFDLSLPLPEPYCIIFRKETKDRPYANEFLSWLIELT